MPGTVGSTLLPYSLLIFAISLSVLLAFCQEDCYEELVICSSYNTTQSSTCYGSLQPNGFTKALINGNIKYAIKPNETVYDLQQGNYSAYIVRNVCDVYQVTFDEVRRSYPACGNVISDADGNSLIVSGCNETVNPDGAGIVIFTNNSCTSLTAGIIVLVDFSDCPLTSCADEEYDCNGLTNTTDIEDCWNECLVDFTDYDECGKCRNFFEEVCSLDCSSETASPDSSDRFGNLTTGDELLCSVICSPQFILMSASQCYTYHQFESEPCPSVVYSDSTSLDCENENKTFCELLCREPANIRASYSNNIPVEDLLEFCVTLPGTFNDCSNISLLQIECVFPLDRRCEAICGDTFDEVDVCFDEALSFCTAYLCGILNATLTLEFQQLYGYTQVVDNLIGDILPGVSIDQLEYLFDDLEDSFLLYNDSNVDLVIDIYDDLFSDEVRSNWTYDEPKYTQEFQSVTGRSKENMNDTFSEDIALLQIESMGDLISRGIVNGVRNTTYHFIGNNFVFAAEVPDLETNVVDDKYRISRGIDMSNEVQGSLEIPVGALCSNINNCSSVVTTSVVRNLADYLHVASTNTSPSIDYTKYMPNSHLISVQVFGVKNLSDRLTENPAEITFYPLQKNSSVVDMSSTLCVFWNHSSKTWSTNGVNTSIFKNDTVKCTSAHLTSFAILVSFRDTENSTLTEEDTALSIVSYVGCAISIFCLLITIFCLIAFRKILNKGSLLYVHLNLTIALLLGYITFVAGIETAVKIQWLCALVAALIQYFFLCVFCWMLCEGIILYLLVVRVFGNAAQKWYWLLILGWGLPIPIVSISAGVLWMDYGNERYCWISSDYIRPALWTFVVPMIIVVLINSVILVLTVCNIVRGKKLGGAETGVSNVTLVKTTIRGTVILLPLLGLTWVIGLFAVDENTTVFAWLFTILNTLQGFFIFLLHILRNRAILRKIRSLFCKSSKKSTESMEMSSTKMATKASAFDSLDHKDSLHHSYPARTDSEQRLISTSSENTDVMIAAKTTEDDEAFRQNL